MNKRNILFAVFLTGAISLSGSLGITVNKNNPEKLYAADYQINEPNLTFEAREVSVFTTKFNPGNVARVQNIKLAVNAINGVIVYPGETFSYNDTVGPTSQKRGFKLAKVIIKGKESKGYGGGVCQVSTTLFNAVSEAGLTVTERHPHSKKVAYVPEGKDAATSYGGIDFKFRNDFAVPVIIEASTSKNSVSISILQGLQTF